MKMPNPKKHHYHPKFLLEGFCSDNNAKLFVYDLRKGKIRPQIPKEVACEDNFYSILTNGKLDKNLEIFFADYIETPASDAIKKFKNSEPLSDQEKLDFATFISLMRIRTPFFLNRIGQLKVCFEQAKLYQEGKNPEFTIPRVREISRSIILQEPFLFNYWQQLTNKILGMKWTLFKAPAGKRFITSDNPLCSILKPSELNKRGFNLFDEFQDPTLRLYLPLSKEYCWLGHFEDNKNDIYDANYDWMTMFERNCVIWADKYVYASTNDTDTFNHAMRYYGISPFDIDVTNLPPDFIPPSTTVKRVKG